MVPLACSERAQLRMAAYAFLQSCYWRPNNIWRSRREGPQMDCDSVARFHMLGVRFLA
jgi:hypothetical protein